MTTPCGPALYVVLCADGALCPAILRSGLPIATSAREPADFRKDAIDAGAYSRDCPRRPHRVVEYVPKVETPR